MNPTRLRPGVHDGIAVVAAGPGDNDTDSVLIVTGARGAGGVLPAAGGGASFSRRPLPVDVSAPTGPGSADVAAIRGARDGLAWPGLLARPGRTSVSGPDSAALEVDTGEDSGSSSPPVAGVEGEIEVCFLAAAFDAEDSDVGLSDVLVDLAPAFGALTGPVDVLSVLVAGVVGLGLACPGRVFAEPDSDDDASDDVDCPGSAAAITGQFAIAAPRPTATISAPILGTVVAQGWRDFSVSGTERVNSVRGALANGGVLP